VRFAPARRNAVQGNSNQGAPYGMWTLTDQQGNLSMDTEFFPLQDALAGEYSFERELGRGGMGVVYLARDVQLDRPVAIKVLPAALAARDDVKARFLREARTAASLSHPNIVPIHRVGELAGVPFFVMTFVDGPTLGERLRERGPVSASVMAQVLRDVASRTAEARHEEEVWRVSAETLADNRSSISFAFLYEYLPGEQQASLAAVSVETDDSLHSDSSTATARACGDSTPPSRRIACWWTLETAHQRCPFLVGRPRQTERQSCRSGCVKRASRRGSWCSAYIRAARSTTPIVTSYVESQNRSPSGWPALAPTSRSANARRR